MTPHPRIATYRIQFRDGMTFDKAAEVVPYLQGLGVSHLYASPIFTATAGSTHGYDVTDYNEIDPAIGGREGFERLSRALKDAGMGLMIDIVPNHMAAALENAWWREVVEQGLKDAMFTPPHHPYTDLLLSSIPEMDPDWLTDLLAERGVDNIGDAAVDKM